MSFRKASLTYPKYPQKITIHMTERFWFRLADAVKGRAALGDAGGPGDDLLRLLVKYMEAGEEAVYISLQEEE